MHPVRKGGDPVDVTIYPEVGNRDATKYIAGVLLSLAEHPSEVQTVSRPTLGFRVSQELFDKFVEFQGSATTEVPTSRITVPASEENPKPAKRAGRPKKEGS